MRSSNIRLPIFKCFYLLLAFLVYCFQVFGQEKVFRAEVDQNPIGINDAIVFTLTLENFSKNVGIPEVKFPEFEIINGPLSSVSREIQNINGKTTISEKVSYSYVLKAKREGTLKIPAALVQHEGKTYHSNSVQVHVQPGSLRKNNQRQSRRRNPFDDPFFDDPFFDNFVEMEERMRRAMEDFFGESRPSQQQLDYREFTEDKLNENIFLKLEVDKNELYEGEPLYVSYKLYSRLQMNVQLHDLPDLNGFWSEDFELPSQITPKKEIVNGKEYNVFTVKKSVLYPQLTGSLILDEAVAKGQAYVADLITDNWGNRFVTQKSVDVTIKNKPIPIHVKKLPKLKRESVNYSGSVGKITREIILENSEVDINEPVLLKIRYKGIGNLALITAPKIQSDNSLDINKPKRLNNYELTSRGLEGEIEFEYLIYARQEGSYRILIPEDASFDYQEEKYVYFEEEEEEIHFTGVLDENNLSGEQGLSIFKGNEESKPISKLNLWWLLLPIIILIASFNSSKIKHFSFKKEGIRDIDKEAWKRLSVAADYMKNKEEKLFYEEISKSLLLFISEKLSIPFSDLNKETYKKALLSKNIPYEKWDEIDKVIEISERALYSPIANVESMEEVLEKAKNSMVILQKHLKNKM